MMNYELCDLLENIYGNEWGKYINNYNFSNKYIIYSYLDDYISFLEEVAIHQKNNIVKSGKKCSWECVIIYKVDIEKYNKNVIEKNENGFILDNQELYYTFYYSENGDEEEKKYLLCNYNNMLSGIIKNCVFREIPSIDNINISYYNTKFIYTLFTLNYKENSDIEFIKYIKFIKQNQ